jgi:hypothetical protein
VNFSVSMVRGRSVYVMFVDPKPKGATTGICSYWYGLSSRCIPTCAAIVVSPSLSPAPPPTVFWLSSGHQSSR